MEKAPVPRHCLGSAAAWRSVRALLLFIFPLRGLVSMYVRKQREIDATRSESPATTESEPPTTTESDTPATTLIRTARHVDLAAVQCLRERVRLWQLSANLVARGRSEGSALQIQGQSCGRRAGFGQYLLLLPVVRGLDALRLRLRENPTCLVSLNSFVVGPPALRLRALHPRGAGRCCTHRGGAAAVPAGARGDWAAQAAVSTVLRARPWGEGAVPPDLQAHSHSPAADPAAAGQADVVGGGGHSGGAQPDGRDPGSVPGQPGEGGADVEGRPRLKGVPGGAPGSRMPPWQEPFLHA